MAEEQKKKNPNIQIWAIRLCAIAAVSSLALAAFSHDKKITKAVATSASTVFWGVGSGMAFNRFLNRHNERD